MNMNMNMDTSAILTHLGLSSAEEAANVLHSLVQDNVIAMDQIKQRIKTKIQTKIKAETKSNTAHHDHDRDHDRDHDDASSIKSKEKDTNNDNKNDSGGDRYSYQYMTRHIALRFHYDGATYNGLAQNVNAPDDNSVERILFAALQKTCLISNTSTGRSDCGYSRSGRTDKGVSAFGQVVALRVRSAFPKGTLFISSGSTSESGSANVPDKNDTDRRELTEMDLPKNSMEKLRCWVPPKPKKKKKGKKGKNHKNHDGCGNGNGDGDGDGDGASPFGVSQRQHQPQNTMVEKNLSERDFAQILNNVLPDTIRVLGWSPVSEGFSARFSTRSRTYRYFFVRRDMDLHAMTRGLEYMTGRHDFRNLCKMNCEEVDNFERVVMYAKIVVTASTSHDDKNVLDDNAFPYLDYVASQQPAVNFAPAPTPTTSADTSCHDGEVDTSKYRQICYFEIQGQAFLWHQIRCIASVLFMIGRGLESPEIVKELLDIGTNPGKPCYPFAPELPLVLHRCEYGNVRFGHSVQNLWRVSCDLECKWEELALASERLKNGLMSLQNEAEVRRRDVMNFVDGILAEQKRKRSRNKDLHRRHRTCRHDDDGRENGDAIEIMLSSPAVSSDGNGGYSNDDEIISWNDAKNIIFKLTGMKPNADGPTVQIHIPLMKRGRGTTYEEKIKAILSADDPDGKGGSKRRRELYEQNIKKKKLSKEEDEKFYNHMAKQGGSGL